AFHSTMLDPVADELTALVENVELSPPEIPYLSNVTGTWIRPEEATDPGYWTRHMCRPVRFSEAVGELLRGDERLLLEVGPGQSLGSFARLHPDCDGERSRAVVSSMPAARGEGFEAARLLGALGSLWCLGAVPDWAAFYEGETRHRVALPTYPFERERHWVEPRFETDAPDAAGPADQGKRPDVSDWFYLPTWGEAGPAGAGEDGPVPESEGTWVVFATGEGAGAEVARRLSESAAEVVRVEPGEAFRRVSDGVYAVRPDAAQDYEELLAELGSGGDRPRRFVHLWTAAPEADGEPGPELFDRHQRLGFYSLTALARAVGRGSGGAQIDVVSTGVQEVTGEEALCPERSTVLGPCIVIPQEHPTIGCRHVDLDAGALEGDGLEASVEGVLAELGRDPEDAWIAHRGGVRWIQSFEPNPLEGGDDVPVFRDGGAYLITGGLGGIGRALARHLAETFGARLVLTRRSEMPERADWDRWLEEHGSDDKTSRTIRAVRELEELGAEVIVASADVADPEAMEGVVQKALDRFGTLHGVIHAAGVLDQDSFQTIQQSDGSECELHFRPKVHGLYVLERALRDVEPDFYLLFSSLSAVLGGLGYVGYAAANLFMDFFAHHRNRSGGGSWISVDWDSWHYPEEGAETGGLGTTLVELALTPEEGVETLRRILGSDDLRHVVISTGDLDARLAQWVELRSMRQAAAGAAGQGLGDLPRGQELERRVAEIWARVLGRDDVGVDENFFELGGNSLLGMQLISELGRDLGAEVSPVMLFEAPTVSALSERLAPEEPDASESPGAGSTSRRRAAAPANEDVAVIAMVGRFPGAKSVEELWENLCAGRETISFFTDEELLDAGVDPEELANPHYVKARPILDDVELFDAPFFGYSPRDAELMDPQHRLFLEAAWELFEEAGYDPERIDSPVGVYGGASISSYMYNIFGNPELAESVGTFPILIGNEKDSVTTKISYKLNLKGPSLAVQTFCSTSLVAAHLACRALINQECDMALAGGVSIILPQKSGYEFQEGGIGSRDGHIRAFDAGASGIVFGNGLGLVALKRLDDALADGDQIHAVIKGSAVNNDGSVKAGYTATSVDGQAELVTDVLERTGIDPETIGYMEAHGSGTPLGDPIEVAALTKAFRRQTDARELCPLGSVKTNVGHLDRTAGVAGLIKTILTLKHKRIPPTVHFQQPNPNIDFEQSPFYVNTEPIDWPLRDGPRRAGVNSLGLGGTNAHALLEEAPEREPSEPAEPYQLLLLSARSEAALERATDRLADHLERHDDLNLADVAYTLQVGRKAMSHRRIAVCRDLDDGVSILRERTPRKVLSALREEKGTPVTFLFPGLGGQYPGMARGLYEGEPVFRDALDRCAELLEPRLGLDLRELLWADAGEDPEPEGGE
ncbi:MAG: SDR family NAD(P)-dependent oxidoreductase, partial [Thermoanaerobaculia bacterium]